ncbi:MAG: FG-GAP repeat protein [Candidatus Omnitrophica bacterium]|nr:FG-GAP repeat protein [Candidatus Omnitrophota bacterium]
MDGPWLLADNAKATEQKNLEIGPNGEIAYPILATLNVLEINTLLYFKLTAFDQNNRAYIDLVQIFNNWNNGKIFASNETDQDAFGFYGLLISNDTAIIATPTANNFKGAAYLFSRNSDGSWPHQETKKLSIGNNVSTSFFGWGVSIFDDTAVVGADSFACVYDRNPDGSWPSQYTQLIQGFPQPGHSRLFGNTFFLTENTLFVSDANATVNNVKSGAVYIFNKNANGAWPENASQIIAPSDGVINSAFGTSLCAQDNTLVVSAPCWSANRSGEIYIFTRDPNTGLWSENQIIFPSDAVPKNYFGEAVSISGETLVVGSDGINSSNIGAGAAYIFIKNTDGTWPQEETQKILPSDGIPGQFFGRSISIDDDVILVGSYGGSNQEGAYLFKKNAEGSWPATETKRILPPDGSSPDLFGAQVFVAANKMLIGNPLGHGATPMVGNAFIISKHLISGIISENGIPLKDVVVRTGDPDIEPVTTTVDGHYQFVVPERWSGWIRLSKDGYCFNPDNGTSTYTHVIDDIIQDYTAMASSAEQTLNLHNGWNMISLNVQPGNPAVESVFAALVAEGKLDIVKDGAGHIFWPAHNINTINNMSVAQGYNVRINQNATLSVQGSAIVLPMTISLNPGWRMMGYPVTSPRLIVDVF